MKTLEDLDKHTKKLEQRFQKMITSMRKGIKILKEKSFINDSILIFLTSDLVDFQFEYDQNMKNANRYSIQVLYAKHLIDSYEIAKEQKRLDYFLHHETKKKKRVN